MKILVGRRFCHLLRGLQERDYRIDSIRFDPPWIDYTIRALQKYHEPQYLFSVAKNGEVGYYYEVFLCPNSDGSGFHFRIMVSDVLLDTWPAI
jgi:hypothetical protein